MTQGRWRWSRSTALAPAAGAPLLPLVGGASRRSLPRGHAARRRPIGWRHGSLAGSADTQALEPLDGGGELVRAGAVIREPSTDRGGRRRRRERLSDRRARDARAAHHRGVRELQPAARAEAAARRASTCRSS